MLEERRRDKPNSRGEENRDVELFFLSLLFVFACLFYFLVNAVNTMFVTNCTLAEPFSEKKKKCHGFQLEKHSLKSSLDLFVLGYQQGPVSVKWDTSILERILVNLKEKDLGNIRFLGPM